MKNFNFFIILLVSLSCFLISCGGDDEECLQEDWLGTYSATSESCTLADFSLAIPSPFEITAGQSDDQIVINGYTFTIDNCLAVPLTTQFECWDRDEDGINDASEDISLDGVFDIEDCPGYGGSYTLSGNQITHTSDTSGRGTCTNVYSK